MINWIEKLGCYVKILSVLNKKKCIGLKEVTRLGFSKETTTPPTFISVQQGEKEKNNIISLEKDGQVIEGDDKLLEHATEYYSELFGTPTEYEVQMDPSIWEDAPKVSSNDNNILCRPFMKTEIKEALWQMDTIKQLDLIKFPLSFFKVAGRQLDWILFSCMMIFTTIKQMLAG